MLKSNVSKVAAMCLVCVTMVGCEEGANSELWTGILGAVGSTVVSLLLGLLFGA
jgi:hypothetical protein